MRRKIAVLLAVYIIISVFSFPVNAAAAAEDHPHYLEENASRYEAYRAKNPGLPADIAIAYVNANVDKGFYNEIVTVADPKSVSVLVSKNFALPADYVPQDLVTVSGNYRLRAAAAEQFTAMKKDMNSKGYKIYVMSAYRTYQTQATKHNTAVKRYGLASADSQYARAGHSEHQTGLAVDILQKTGVRYMTQAKFQNSKEYAWLTENAHKYGFILRYPKDYTDIHGFIYEPWHWRFVGVDVATTMYNDGIVMLEEYYGRYLVPGDLPAA